MNGQSQKAADSKRNASVQRSKSTQDARAASSKGQPSHRLKEIERTLVMVRDYIKEHPISSERSGKVIAMQNIRNETRRLEVLRSERARKAKDNAARKEQLRTKSTASRSETPEAAKKPAGSQKPKTTRGDEKKQTKNSNPNRSVPKKSSRPAKRY